MSSTYGSSSGNTTVTSNENSPPTKSASPSSQLQNISAEKLEKMLAKKEIIEAVAQELAGKISNNTQLFSTLTSDVAKLLSKEKRRWVWLSLVLAIVSLAMTSAVFWLSLSSKTDPTGRLAIISAFFLVVLVINIGFNMMVFRVTR